MTELGDVLDLMHSSIRRWRTLRAEGVEWRHRAGLSEAWVRWVAQQRRGGGVAVIGHEEEAEPEPEQIEERWRLWLEQPDRTRSEFAVEDETVTMVAVGNTWWSWSPSRETTTNAGNPHHSHGTGPGHALVDPAPILPATELEVLGGSLFLGRSAIRVVAIPSPIDEDDEESSDWLSATHGLGPGADDYLLTVDADRGVLLRSEARIAREPFRRIEMAAVAFDEDFPEQQIFRPPEGEEIVRLEPSRSVSLADLPSAVPFAVLVPEHPPFGPPHASIEPPDPRLGIPLQVHIRFASPMHGEEERQFWLIESAEPIPDRPWVDWKEGDVRLGLDRNVRPPLLLVRLERSGTHVEIQSNHVGEDELLGLARSLVPLPATPPGVSG